MTKFKLIAWEKEKWRSSSRGISLILINPKMRAKIFGLLGILRGKREI